MVSRDQKKTGCRRCWSFGLETIRQGGIEGPFRQVSCLSGEMDSVHAPSCIGNAEASAGMGKARKVRSPGDSHWARDPQNREEDEGTGLQNEQTSGMGRLPKAGWRELWRGAFKCVEGTGLGTGRRSLRKCAGGSCYPCWHCIVLGVQVSSSSCREGWTPASRQVVYRLRAQDGPWRAGHLRMVFLGGSAVAYSRRGL